MTPSAFPIPASLQGAKFAWTFSAPRGVYVNPELEYFLKLYGEQTYGTIGATKPGCQNVGLPRQVLATGVRITQLGSPPGQWGADEDDIADKMAKQLTDLVALPEWNFFELMTDVPAGLGQCKTIWWSGYQDEMHRTEPVFAALLAGAPVQRCPKCNASPCACASTVRAKSVQALLKYVLSTQGMAAAGFFGNGWDPTATATTSVSISVPKTRAGAERLLEELLALPDGFLAKLYLTLYEGKDLRIESAKRDASAYLKGLDDANKPKP